MKKIISFALLIIMLLTVSPVLAQSPAPYVIKSTRPMSAELRGYLDAWLAIDAPSTAPYYIVTYFHARGTDTLVSLVGVNLASPDEAWSLEDEGGKTVWLGTVLVSENGDVSPFSTEPQQARGVGRLAMPSLAAGGGSYVSFPFAAGTAAMFGPRGVHGSGDYGTSGMLAIDLVGGDNMGASSMPPNVYASDDGTIDYVCDDGTTVAVRTHNETTGDYFLYAHMLDNDNLVIDHTFTHGELIGSLKYGSFDPTHPNCGWADQAASHYHVHWMFTPASGKYQVGSCTLTISTQVWQCGSQTVKVAGFLTGGGGVGSSGSSGSAGSHSGSGGTGAGAVVTDPTFWDYILTGILSVAEKGTVKLLPSHSPFAYTYMLFNIVDIVLRLGWVLIESNINLEPLLSVLIAGIGIKLMMLLAQSGAAIWRLLKTIPFL